MTPNKTEMGNYLEQLAKKGEVVWYTELYEHFGISKDNYLRKNRPIHQLLNELVQDDSKAKRPLRASVVVGKEKERHKSKLIPKDAYFKVLCEIKGIPMPKNIAEKRLLHSQELKALKKHYGFQSQV